MLGINFEFITELFKLLDYARNEGNLVRHKRGYQDILNPEEFKYYYNRGIKWLYDLVVYHTTTKDDPKYY